MNTGRNADSIERYLAGRMTPSEESAFLLRLEREPALRRALDAEERITRTLLKDRASLPSAPAEGRVYVLDMLARRSLDASTAPGASWISRLFGGTMMRGLAIAAVGISATIAVMQLGDTAEPEGRSGPASRVSNAPAETQPAAPRDETVTRGADESPAVRHDARAAGAVEGMERNEAARASGIAVERSAPRPVPVAPQEREPLGVRSVTSLSSQPDEQSTDRAGTQTPAVQVVPERREPTVVTADTMRVPVTIDLGKIRRSAPKN